jgi:hypothetical protein
MLRLQKGLQMLFGRGGAGRATANQLEVDRVAGDYGVWGRSRTSYRATSREYFGLAEAKENRDICHKRNVSLWLARRPFPLYTISNAIGRPGSYFQTTTRIKPASRLMSQNTQHKMRFYWFMPYLLRFNKIDRTTRTQSFYNTLEEQQLWVHRRKT